jgi:hypothetical protein
MNLKMTNKPKSTISKLNTPTKIAKAVDRDLAPRAKKIAENEAKDVLGGALKLGAKQTADL